MWRILCGLMAFRKCVTDFFVGSVLSQEEEELCQISNIYNIIVYISMCFMYISIYEWKK